MKNTVSGKKNWENKCCKRTKGCCWQDDRKRVEFNLEKEYFYTCRARGLTSKETVERRYLVLGNFDVKQSQEFQKQWEMFRIFVNTFETSFQYCSVISTGIFIRDICRLPKSTRRWKELNFTRLSCIINLNLKLHECHKYHQQRSRKWKQCDKN